MSTLQTQYKNYLKDNNKTSNDLSYNDWVTNVFLPKFTGLETMFIDIETEHLALKPDGKNRYLVYFKQNMKCIGVFSMDVDGYYHFWSNNDGGSWESYELRMIADALDKVNKPYDDHIKENLK
jgi:hypothetical protein